MVNSIKRNPNKTRLFCIVVLCLVLCMSSMAFAAQTTVVYKGLNMQLPFVTGVYQLSLGPFTVETYSKIRVYTFGNSGSGIIHVTLANTSASGENNGILDDYDLDFSGTYYRTGMYEIPGKYLKVYLQSLNATYASIAIYGQN